MTAASEHTHSNSDKRPVSEWTRDLLARRAVQLPAPITMSGTAGVIAFTFGLPDEPSFPAQALADVTREVMQDQFAPALQYGHPRPLTDFLVRYIKREQGLEVTPQNIQVTAGSSQAISFICELLLNPGDVVIVEAPSFLGAVNTFHNAEAEVVETPLDENGLIIEALESKLAELKAAGKKVKFIYTIPTFQNPTGVTMTLERRKALLDVARRYETFILEDDAYYGLEFGEKSPPWLWTLDDSGIVLHCGTFSKTLAPGMRLGWVGGPPELISLIARLRDGGGTNAFSGYVAARFAESGQLDKHIEVLREIYRKKRDRMLAALERYMPDGSRWTEPQGGFFVWLELPEKVDTVKMLPAAIQAGVNYLPGPACFASRSGRNTIRLAFSYIKLEEIEPGLRILGEVIERELNS
ncbi:MAG TPA: PLP-dependent aminotransferase family protein [Chloroflexia bacterium]|nr:PLP-dependent aminotransferase family protein [Chloroflexia bacterium]